METPNNELTLQEQKPLEIGKKEDVKEEEEEKKENEEEQTIFFPAFSEINTDIVFYDVETTVPNDDTIEFAAIILDRHGLFEKERYTTLLKSEKITRKSSDINKITADMLKTAPTFADVAEKVFQLLNNKIWAGHNINTFDNKQIAKEFKRLNRDPPKPSGLIDTLPLLRGTFGKRAGDMKLASLGRYFGLGEEKHRALADCEMNISVFKNCCTILFLEEHLQPKTITPSTKKAKRGPRKTPIKTDSAPATPLTPVDASTPTSATSIPIEIKNASPQTASPTKVWTPKSSSPKTPNSNPSTPNKDIKNNNGGTTPLGKGEQETIDPEIFKKIDEAINAKASIWISYSGGTKGIAARKITPTKWLRSPKLFSATCGDSSSQSTFSTGRVVRVENEQF